MKRVLGVVTVSALALHAPTIALAGDATSQLGSAEDLAAIAPHEEVDNLQRAQKAGSASHASSVKNANKAKFAPEAQNADTANKAESADMADRKDPNVSIRHSNTQNRGPNSSPNDPLPDAAKGTCAVGSAVTIRWTEGTSTCSAQVTSAVQEGRTLVLYDKPEGSNLMGGVTYATCEASGDFTVHEQIPEKLQDPAEMASYANRQDVFMDASSSYVNYEKKYGLPDRQTCDFHMPTKSAGYTYDNEYQDQIDPAVRYAVNQFLASMQSLEGMGLDKKTLMIWMQHLKDQREEGNKAVTIRDFFRYLLFEERALIPQIAQGSNVSDVVAYDRVSGQMEQGYVYKPNGWQADGQAGKRDQGWYRVDDGRAASKVGETTIVNMINSRIDPPEGGWPLPDGPCRTCQS